MAASAVARGEDAVHVGGELAVLGFVGLPVAARILRFQAEHFRGVHLRADETGRQQHQVGGPDLFAAFDFGPGRAAFGGLGPVDVDGTHAGDVSAAVVDEFLGEQGVAARVVARAWLLTSACE